MRTNPLLDPGASLESAIAHRGRTSVAPPRRTTRRFGEPVRGVLTTAILLGLIGGCGEATPNGRSATPPAAAQFDFAALVPPDAAPAPSRSYGRFHVTMYHVATEAEVDGPLRTARGTAPPPRAATADQGEAASDDDAGDDDAVAVEETAEVGFGTDDTTLAAIAPIAGAAKDGALPAYDRNCEPLAHVSRAFRRELTLQGTGKLRDGRMLNVAARCKCEPCFHVLPPHHRWGIGGSGLALEPFRSVAVDPARIKLGSLLYIPALDGLRMPGREPVGGFVHDGCVIAADTGGGIRGAQIDLFVARRAYLSGLARRGGSHAWMDSLEVFDGTERCQRKGGKVSQSAVASI